MNHKDITQKVLEMYKIEEKNMVESTIDYLRFDIFTPNNLLYKEKIIYKHETHQI